jgi:type IV fimbrial biogenesis protein FimT
MRRSALGFTLIELMVTVAIAVILMAVAAPSFIAFQQNAELTSRTNSLLATINTARSEAMKRGRNAMVVPVDGTTWASGMIVFVDLNDNDLYNADVDFTVYQFNDPLPAYLSITGTAPATGSAPYMLFDAQGYPKTTGNAVGNFTLSIQRNDLTGTPLLEQTRRIIVAKTGRARSCRPDPLKPLACKATNSSE